MSECADKICIEDIMNEIREEIKRENYDSSMLSFEDIECDESLIDRNTAASGNFEENYKYLRAHCEVNPNKQMPGGEVEVFVKKVIRKLMKFYIEPYSRDQNQLNVRYTQMLGALKEESDRTNDLMQKKLLMLENKISKLEKENEELRKILEGKA
ncbi:MAG: hypothetical protein IJP18_09115 [Oscillospiraceae bacterium]|nr:hypothetical protein [Ruminococcus sp.]MBP1565906.1 hypothetical protein [Oscillospiraceae bacterium]MBQ9982714.1 hypothetical protein [Oscillospiraceae bacterium]